MVYYHRKKGISERELKDLLKAWGAISLAFAIVFTPDIPLFQKLLSPRFYTSFIFSALTVGIGFIGHEMAHRYVARKYNCWAEFRADDRMLLIAIAVSFLGFIFAAPGAVVIMGKVDQEKSGKISTAGPFANIILGIIFLILSFLVIPLQGFLIFGMKINGFLAAFNCLPFGFFDGAKIFRWNKLVWIMLLVGGLTLAFY